MEKIKAYKVFDSNWSCRDFQYEVGKSYTHKGKLIVCLSGFHACVKPVDCFNYYGFDPKNKVAEVLMSGKIQTHDGDSKVAATEIEIVREVKWAELLELVNSGNENSGYGNSGDENSGNRNSGYGNSGNENSGDGNSGYGNSTNHSSGIFCSSPNPLIIFNKPTSLTWDELEHPDFGAYSLNKFVPMNMMTEPERETHPKAETTGGYLKTYSHKEMWANGWEEDSDENKSRFFKLPNFDLQIFKEITSIDASKDYERLMK